MPRLAMRSSKTSGRAPPAGVDAYNRDAQPVSDFNLFERQVDILLPFGFVGVNIALVCGHAAKVKAVDKSMTFDFFADNCCPLFPSE